VCRRRFREQRRQDQRRCPLLTRACERTRSARHHRRCQRPAVQNLGRVQSVYRVAELRTSLPVRILGAQVDRTGNARGAASTDYRPKRSPWGFDRLRSTGRSPRVSPQHRLTHGKQAGRPVQRPHARGLSERRVRSKGVNQRTVLKCRTHATRRRPRPAPWGVQGRGCVRRTTQASVRVRP
jgi:hypothetical protein